MRAPRRAWWPFLGLFLLAILVLGFIAYKVTGPLDVDGAYYFLVARNLAQGRGMVVNALWHFFHPTGDLPQPAGDLWMPLPSLLMVPPLYFGSSFRLAQVVQVLLGALLPLLACHIAREEGAPWPWAVLAGLLAIFAGTVTVHWVDSDSYTAYALVGGTALYAMGRTTQDDRWFIVAGLLGGLAALTRNDGVLLLGVLWLQALLISRRQRRRPPWRPLLLGTGLFLLPVLGWSLRNLATFGRPTPVSLAFLLTMRDYSDLFAYRPQPHWEAFWQQGWTTLLATRRDALGASLTVLAAYVQIWGLVPLLAIALTIRRWPRLWPAFLYLAGLFLALNGCFPLLVLHGTWSRSLNAFLPAGYACVALGLSRVVARLLRWRPQLPPRLAGHTFVAITALAIVLTGGSAMALQLESAREHPATWQQIGHWLQAHSTPDEVIMAQDPMAVLLYGERRAIGIPQEPLPQLTEVAQRYNVTKVVLVGRFQGLLPEALQELYAGATSQGPFTLLWQEGEIQIYGLRGP